MNEPFCRFPIERYPAITLAHGGGGRLTQQLIDSIFRPAFRSPSLEAQGDGAILELNEARVAFTTDSFVVRPLFFPGGDIGKLAVMGTCNDLAMCGARPRWISVAMILEEGLPVETLMKLSESIAQAAAEIGVEIATGDTKVVEHGKGDGIYINTTGLGQIEPGVSVDPERIEPGDRIIVSGSLGRHGVAILSSRQGLEFETPVSSDCTHLWPVVEDLFKAGIRPHAFRDLTRGGLATALIELAQTRGLEFRVDEMRIPVEPSVRGACEMLGLDPMYVANEGTLVTFVPAVDADRTLTLLASRDPTASHGR